MQILIVNFSLDGLTDEEFRAASAQLAPAFAEVPGLRTKTWLAAPERNTYGGVYLFEDAAALDAYLESPLFAGVRANPAFVDQSAVRFDVLEGPSAVTGIPTALAAS
jgi:hypothetical protein